ncbi:cysteine desulfurase family protein [Flavobacterium glaciei]|uniref:cysteine desulfurase n=1 Tax=Flavobacterium glaciei TaxID=386300 RepID=A0A562PUZ6_9FLAO|nr:cysteine desulfurase family protein [Flavobacterium glaciei]RDI56288.1 cysteine desulfurase [Flavobacterium glaciei]TWI48198.1 cysteine desulfurase [Flavobacterium glaciei]
MSINYFDTASTTKVDSRVLEAMLPYFNEIYGNASSNHIFGKTAKKAIELARKQVSELINANENEIIFTSGATESINLALKGFFEANYDKGNHIITVKTEHKAVLSTCEYLETKGVEVTYLDVDNNGLISIDDLKKAIRKDTILICIMFVNNETGVIQPINEIGLIAKESEIIFFSDATQAVGKIWVDVEKDNIDMLCFSGHKLNAPKGVGILFKKRNIELTPLIHGGSQENGLRAGTYNTPLIVGLGKACEIALQELDDVEDYIIKLNSYLIQELKKLKGVVIIGNEKNKVYNIVDVMIPDLNSDIFIAMETGSALSNGSACTSEIIESSHVLKAMGFSDVECNQTIRISIYKEINESKINDLITILKAEIKNI